MARSEEDAFPRADGSLDWARWELRPWYTGTCEVGGVILFSEVITERVRAERALRAANQALAEAGRRKTEFLAVLSHEMRNPLGPIRNSLALLERAPPGGEVARHSLEVIRRQTDQLTRLVDDLLDVSRISRGKVTLLKEDVDLAVANRLADERAGEG